MKRVNVNIDDYFNVKDYFD